MKNNSPHLKEILLILRQIQGMLWVENPADLIKSLERRLDIQAGNDEELEKKIKGLEDYFKIKFVKNQQYERSTIIKKR